MYKVTLTSALARNTCLLLVGCLLPTLAHAADRSPAAPAAGKRAARPPALSSTLSPAVARSIEMLKVSGLMGTDAFSMGRSRDQVLEKIDRIAATHGPAARVQIKALRADVATHLDQRIFVSYGEGRNATRDTDIRNWDFTAHNARTNLINHPPVKRETSVPWTGFYQNLHGGR